MADDCHHSSMEQSESATGSARSVEAYETETGTVFYDAGNPLAWIESSVTIPIMDAN